MEDGDGRWAMGRPRLPGGGLSRGEMKDVDEVRHLHFGRHIIVHAPATAARALSLPIHRIIPQQSTQACSLLPAKN